MSSLYVRNHCLIFTFIVRVISNTIIVIINLHGAEDQTQGLSLMLDKCSTSELDPQLEISHSIKINSWNFSSLAKHSNLFERFIGISMWTGSLGQVRDTEEEKKNV